LHADEVVRMMPETSFLKYFKSDTKSPALSPANISAVGNPVFHYSQAGRSSQNTTTGICVYFSLASSIAYSAIAEGASLPDTSN